MPDILYIFFFLTLYARPVSLKNLNDTVLLLLDFADTLREQNMMLRVRVFMDVRNLTMVMEEMKLVDTRHTQIIKNFTILKGSVRHSQLVNTFLLGKLYYIFILYPKRHTKLSV